MADWGKALEGMQKGMMQGASIGLDIDKFTEDNRRAQIQLQLQAEQHQANMQAAQDQHYQTSMNIWGKTTEDLYTDLVAGKTEKVRAALLGPQGAILKRVGETLKVPLGMWDQSNPALMEEVIKTIGENGRIVRDLNTGVMNPSTLTDVQYRGMVGSLGRELSDKAIATGTAIRKDRTVSQPDFVKNFTEIPANTPGARLMVVVDSNGVEKEVWAKKHEDEYGNFYKAARMDAALASRSQTAARTLDNNYVIKQLTTQQVAAEGLQKLVSLAQGGNQVAANSMGAKAARAMGEVGVLTETDVSRYVAGRSVPRKFVDKMKSWINGTPTDMTLDEIKEAQGIFTQVYAEKVQPIVNQHIERFAKQEKVSLDRAGELLGYQYVNLGAPATNPNTISNELIDQAFGLQPTKKKAK
jgi:hypothetical protein